MSVAMGAASMVDAALASPEAEDDDGSDFGSCTRLETSSSTVASTGVGTSTPETCHAQIPARPRNAEQTVASVTSQLHVAQSMSGGVSGAD